MCLHVNQNLTNEIKKLSGKLTVWKNFAVDYEYKTTHEEYTTRTELVGATLKARYLGFDYSAGVHTAPNSKIYNGKVNEGLHVCLSEEEANSLGRPSSGYYVVIPLTIDIKDLVAVGIFSDYATSYYNSEHVDQQAVVTKFTLSQAKIDKALKSAVDTYLQKYPNYAPKKKVVRKR